MTTVRFGSIHGFSVTSSNEFVGLIRWDIPQMPRRIRNGSQVWVQTRNGKIINAGVNLIPK